MDTENLQPIFEKEGINIEISCEKAFEISDKYGIKKTDIAKFCNVNKIKIHGCQLGCFK
jgi:hypothetical protein